MCMNSLQNNLVQQVLESTGLTACITQSLCLHNRVDVSGADLLIMHLSLRLMNPNISNLFCFTVHLNQNYLCPQSHEQQYSNSCPEEIFLVCLISISRAQPVDCYIKEWTIKKIQTGNVDCFSSKVILYTEMLLIIKLLALSYCRWLLRLF